MWSKIRSWLTTKPGVLWNDVLIPLALSRILLTFTGWFGQYFPSNAHYPSSGAVERGWHFSPYRLLDIWGRWDTGWYMSIVANGYSVRGDLKTVQSNIAFFPLYPYMVKFFTLLLPRSWVNTSTILLIGVLISNIMLTCALVLLYKLVNAQYGRPVAARTVLYILVFPASLYLSCFYTEATFLFFSVAAFYTAYHRKWLLTGLCCALATLTRGYGLLLMIPLLWIYGESVQWRRRNIRPNVVWTLFAPLALGLFLFYMYRLTGNWLAPFQAVGAWGRRSVLPWQTLFNPYQLIPYMTTLEQVFMVGAVCLTIVTPFLLRSGSYTLYALLFTLTPLSSGMLTSNIRYMSTAFVLFITLAIIGKHRLFHQSTVIVMSALQAIFMFGWSQFYWIA